MPVTTSFGAWLKRRRRALDLTQEELAGKVGCSVEMVYKIEADERRPSKQIAQRLASALEFAPGEHEDFIRFARTGIRAASLAEAEFAAANPLERASSSAPPTLPAPLTSLVGRAEESAAIVALLKGPHVRLLTLSGPPGVGKTRLALHVAATLRDAFADGVFWAALAPLADPRLVPTALAQALGIAEVAGYDLVARLKDQLRDKQALLVLDNCEHLPAVAPLIADILGAATRLRVLATSRARLRVYGEHEYEVQPLGLPDVHQDTLSLMQLSAFSAITLFVQRARAVKRSFQLTEDNAPAVRALCARLDGLPLAIELATVRIKFFTPQALLTRLHASALSLLTGGPKDVPTRQRTLRATIAWSYQLLSPQEQRLFARISIFTSGCTLAAAEAVCNTDSALDVFETIVALAEQSLLQQRQEAGGEPRFFMLETIREYALEQLAARGEHAELEQRYADYYVALAERAEPQLTREAQWVHLLEHEHNNIRAVLAWAILHARCDIGMRVCGALWQFWYIRGNIEEGRQWITQILDICDGVEAAVRAKVFEGAGVLAWAHGHYIEAQRYQELALQLYRDLRDHKGIANNLESLGHVRLYLRDYAEAMTLCEEALAIRREMGDLNGIAASLNDLGSIAFFQVDYQKALVYFEEALDISRRTGNIQKIVTLLSNLAAIAYHQAEFDRALQLYKESLSINRQLGYKDIISTCLEGIALILVGINKLEQAAVLFGAVSQLREISGLLAQNASHEPILQTICIARKELGAAWDEYWDEGKITAIEQILLHALSLSLYDAWDEGGSG
jgi:predicted ATPase/transcriptional regulator with XRE-family HTH domain